MKNKKVGSITLAVGLITMGALLFAQNFMELPIKDIYKYWPVLLIGLGLEMVLYMLLYGKSNTEVKLSVDGLCIVFIIILGLVSSGLKFVNFNIPGRVFFEGNGSTFINGIKYRTQITERYIKGNISESFDIKELKVANDFGDIKVISADSRGIRVEADIVVKCNNEEKAREYAKNAIKIIEGEVTELSPQVPEGWNQEDYSKAQIDFVIYVPKEIDVNAEGTFGDINVNGIGGSCRLKNKNGEIKVDDIGGSLYADNSFGDIVISGVGGTAEIINRNGEISANNIKGSAVIENHFGDISAKRIGGNLKVTSNNGELTVEEVKGKAEMSNSFGDINLDEVEGGIIVENKNGNIEAERISGDAKISNSFGDINFKSKTIEDSDIYAKTRFGSIYCNEGLKMTKEGQDTILEGKLGSGKYKLVLETSNGDIDIK